MVSGAFDIVRKMLFGSETPGCDFPLGFRKEVRVWDSDCGILGFGCQLSGFGSQLSCFRGKGSHPVVLHESLPPLFLPLPLSLSDTDSHTL